MVFSFTARKPEYSSSNGCSLTEIFKYSVRHQVGTKITKSFHIKGTGTDFIPFP